MNRLFIHQPVFRLLGPVFIGIMMYMLILLLNNDTAQIGGLFESQEVYVCIITSYLIIETNRLVIRFFDNHKNSIQDWQKYLITGILNVLVSTLMASSAMYFYFTFFVGFSPGSSEMWIFNIICVVISAMYFTLYISHSLLYGENTMRLANEQMTKDAIVDEFSDFRNDINPALLYSSLERVITLAYENPDRAEELIDHLSSVYRYMLGHKQTELVMASDEILATQHLVYLLNELPDYNVKLAIDIKSTDTLHVVPGTLISLIERISKRSITNINSSLNIQLYIEEEYLVIQHKSNERLNLQDHNMPLEKTQRAYSYFTDIPLVEVSAYEECYTKIPILVIQQEIVA